MITTLQFMIKSRISLKGNVELQEFMNEITSMSDDLTSIRLRNQYSAVIETNLMNIVTNKLYSSELSSFGVSYSNKTVIYPKSMIKYFNNLDIRKPVISKIVKKQIQPKLLLESFYENKDNIETFTSTKSADYELSSQLLNQNVFIPFY